ncbi:hypothetical protein MAR_031391 [Mya arenaria]|uniref:RRM domain-containing protein n=1 Tax=Mya arenaria TaxID=6604 RepID=A0ABY7F711_MYAAR|nr:hypothetical protein MAR_031391 [Mya arenaria]
MAGDVEIIDFTRPDGSRKNLFITNIPGKLADEDVVYQLRETFEPYGLLFRVQVFPTQWKPKPDPLVRIQATGKCRKLCHMRAIENAFSHLLLVILGNGKVHVEIDTTVPELRTDVVKDDQLVKVTELSDQPMMEQEMNDKEDATTTSVSTNKLSASALDDINLQILQELEDDMCAIDSLTFS